MKSDFRVKTFNDFIGQEKIKETKKELSPIDKSIAPLS